MSWYTLKDLIEDCVNKKSRTDLPRNAKRKVLGEIWEAMNLWIDSQFDKGQGVNIPQFGKISWETVEVNLNGEKKTRPYFNLTEMFCRGNGVPFKKRVTDPMLAKCAEINMSILAIRHSQTLTKDQVFTGLRDIFQQLGTVIATGRKVKIQFHVGQLVSKERKVAMLFDVQRFREYLTSGEEWKLLESEFFDGDEGNQEASEAGDEAGESIFDASAHGDTLDGFVESRVMEDSLPRLDLPANDNGTVEVDALKQAFENSMQREQMVRTDAGESGILDDPELEGTGEVRHAREAVIEEAYKRHLHKMSNLVDMEDFDQRQMDEQHFQREMLAQMRRKEQFDERKRLQGFIKKQMNDKNAMKKVERDEWLQPKQSSLPINAPSYHVDEGDMGGEELNWQEKELQVKQELLSSLQNQIQDKAARESANKKFARDEEQQFLSHVAQELHAHRANKVAEEQHKQTEMLNAWGRDNYMKAALKDRREHLAVTRPNPFAPNRDFSVGFDVRSARSEN
jgi:hypothetical protein